MIRISRSVMMTALHHSAVISLVLLSSHSFAESELTGEHSLPLPRWSEQELKTFRNSPPLANSPGVLLPNNNGTPADINELIQAPLSSGPRLDHFFKNSELSPRLRAEDMRFFLPESILGLPTQDQPSPVQAPTPLTALRDVSPEFLAACMQSLPREYLIDPDQFVPEIQHHDMMRLLEFHAQDARIKLYVLMIDHDQKLPEGAELDKIASGSLLHADACLLVYPLGEPWRTRLFVSSTIHNQISTDFLRETIQACLQESLQTSNVHDQLRLYTIQLSTRLFWLQRALKASPQSKPASGQALAELSPQVKATAVPSSSSFNFSGIMTWSTASLALLGLAGFSVRRLRQHLRLKRQRCVWMLPEPETVPRLGGAFTGGGGSMIRYA